MTYKYEAELSLLENCPPSGVVPCDQDSYRFVHADITDARNFICVSRLNPSRKLKPEHRCSGLGLSLFVSQEAATKRYRELLSSNRNIGKTLGDKLSAGVIKPEDGRMSQPSIRGHFDLWEAKTADIAPRFRIVVDLNP